MKLLTLFFALVLSISSWGQIEQLNLKNALVVGQMDKSEDRFSVEINITELLTNAGVKASPSLNVLKLGSSAELLTTDSIKALVASKGFDTYLLISIRGYDKKFKATNSKDDLATALGAGNLFQLYRDEVTSVSFEFMFFRNNVMVASDIIRCSNVSNRDAVVKKLRKAVSKRITKTWK
ncbi:MAG: hypothetical protein K9G40_00515 [Crocinitomicaceae bacterium]|nr:hypothetical protein [Crocinitomicaceae bacterium]MCF8433133.1 hypothetical protein [Crocinitomicaceae bacterium]